MAADSREIYIYICKYYMYVYMCIYMYVCMYVYTCDICVYVIYVCMAMTIYIYACILHTYICIIYLYMHVYMHEVPVYVDIYVCMIYIYVWLYDIFVLYIYMYVCIYIFVYIHISFFRRIAQSQSPPQLLHQIYSDMIPRTAQCHSTELLTSEGMDSELVITSSSCPSSGCVSKFSFCNWSISACSTLRSSDLSIVS